MTNNDIHDTIQNTKDWQIRYNKEQSKNFGAP